ncbi:MAG: hypothetical protein GY842_00560 [bacterium]|nr:hypothetical protein [bacterium]
MADERRDDPILAQVTAWYTAKIGSQIAPIVDDELYDLTRVQRDLTVWEYAYWKSRSAKGIKRWNVVSAVAREPDMAWVKAWVESGKTSDYQDAPRRGDGQRQESTIRRKPPAEDVDAETRERQRAALAELRRRQREREE